MSSSFGPLCHPADKEKIPIFVRPTEPNPAGFGSLYLCHALDFSVGPDCNRSHNSTSHMELPGRGRVLRVYLVFYQVPSGRFSDSNNVRIRCGRGLSEREGVGYEFSDFRRSIEIRGERVGVEDQAKSAASSWPTSPSSSMLIRTVSL